MQQIHTLQYFQIHSVGNVHLFVIGLAFDNDNINECPREREREREQKKFNKLNVEYEPAQIMIIK